MKPLTFEMDGSITTESVNAFTREDFSEWIFERLNGHDPLIAFDLSVHWSPHVFFTDLFHVLNKDAKSAFIRATETHLRHLIIGNTWTKPPAQIELLRLGATVLADGNTLISDFYGFVERLLSYHSSHLQPDKEGELDVLVAALEFLNACKWGRRDSQQGDFWENVADMALARFQVDHDEDRAKRFMVAVVRGLARTNMHELLGWLKTIDEEKVPRYQEYLDFAVFSEFLAFVDNKQGANLLAQILSEELADADFKKRNWILDICRKLKVRPYFQTKEKVERTSIFNPG